MRGRQCHGPDPDVPTNRHQSRGSAARPHAVGDRAGARVEAEDRAGRVAHPDVVLADGKCGRLPARGRRVGHTIGPRIDPRHGPVLAVRAPDGPVPDRHGTRAVADGDRLDDFPGAGIMRVTVPDSSPATHTEPAPVASATGCPPTAMRLVTRPERRSTLTTSPSSVVAAHSAPNPTATARRPFPTGIRCTTRLTPGSTCTSVPCSPPATQSEPPPKARPTGSGPTSIVSTRSPPG